MPTNKKESLIYTVLMCFIMVLWMSVYNVTIHSGGFTISVLKDAWIGFPFAYVVAILFDLLIVSKVAKGFAFTYLIKAKDKELRKIIVISSCMVIPMVLIMSFYGALEVCMSSGMWNSLGIIWITNIPVNFIMALPFQLLIAGPFVRYVFRKNFPLGSITA